MAEQLITTTPRYKATTNRKGDLHRLSILARAENSPGYAAGHPQGNQTHNAAGEALLRRPSQRCMPGPPTATEQRNFLL